MIDPVKIFSNINDNSDKMKTKESFCELLIEELTKIKGKDLAPYLSDVVLDKKSQTTKVILAFPIISHVFDSFVGEREPDRT